MILNLILDHLSAITLTAACVTPALNLLIIGTSSRVYRRAR